LTAPRAARTPESHQGEPAWTTLTRRRLAAFALFAGVALGALYYVVPRVAGLDRTWDRIEDGDPWWLGVGVALELLSFACYVLLFRLVFVRPGSLLGWRESYRITMAGLAATRLFAAAGAGGIVLTVWALRRSGMERIEVGARMTTFMVLLYGVYMLAVVVFGVALWTGLLPGGGAAGITLVPAVFAGAVIAVALGLAVPRVTRAEWSSRTAAARAAVGSGVRTALALVRARSPAVVAAAGWWAFDVGVLWACLHAFGTPPPVPVVVMSYFVGMAANTLPVPGGVGSVDAGMIGALIAFGVDGGLAIVGVLSYRAFAFWLPTIPGALAFIGLRRTVREWNAAAAG
jgi:uncharacterized membrane protein YbhN (UPF0104 family)